MSSLFCASPAQKKESFIKERKYRETLFKEFPIVVERAGSGCASPLKPRKANRRERATIDKYSDAGFNVIAKGWPDLLVFNDAKIIAVEVKPVRHRVTEKMGLSSHQKLVHEVLRRAGIEVVVEYV